MLFAWLIVKLIMPLPFSSVRSFDFIQGLNVAVVTTTILVSTASIPKGVVE